jgi:hypothetical protein
LTGDVDIKKMLVVIAVAILLTGLAQNKHAMNKGIRDSSSTRCTSGNALSCWDNPDDYFVWIGLLGSDRGSNSPDGDSSSNGSTIRTATVKVAV